MPWIDSSSPATPLITGYGNFSDVGVIGHIPEEAVINSYFFLTNTRKNNSEVKQLGVYFLSDSSGASAQLIKLVTKDNSEDVFSFTVPRAVFTRTRKFGIAVTAVSNNNVESPLSEVVWIKDESANWEVKKE
jgi:hypothetical protein